MKVIAILNKPKSCSGCPFDHVEFAYEECRLSKRQLSDAESLQIPEWCEMKPMPQKKDTFGKLTFDKMAEYIGWNNCIDEITGETDDVLHD